MDSPSKKLAAFRVVRTKAKDNSDNEFGHGNALLKISGHISTEMSIFGVLNLKFLEVFTSNT